MTGDLDDGALYSDWMMMLWMVTLRWHWRSLRVHTSLRPGSRTDRQVSAADSVSVTGDLDDGALYGDWMMMLWMVIDGTGGAHGSTLP